MRSFDVDIRDSGRVRRRGEGKRQRRGERESVWIPGYGRIVRVQNSWLQILLSSSKTRRNQ